MNKIIGWVVVILIIIGIIWWAGSRPASAPVTGTPVVSTTESMKIGAILPLSGPIAAAGGYSKHGVEMAVADLAAAGKPVEVVFEDGQYDSKVAVSAYNKLKTVDGVKAILDFGTPQVMPLVPLVNADKIPLMGLLAGISYSSPNDYTYRVVGSAVYEAQAAYDVLVTKLGKKKIAVFYLNNDYGTGARDAFKQLTVGGPATVVAEEGAPPGTTDYRSQLTKIKATSPDAMFIASLYKEAGTILKQAKELGIQGPFMCGQPCDTPDLLSTAGAAAEGLILAAPTNQETSGFTERYKARYPGEPVSYLALRSYDAINVLGHVAPNCAAENYSGTCLKKELDNLKDFPGLSYPINFDANGDIHDQFVLKVIRDGKYVPYQ